MSNTKNISNNNSSNNNEGFYFLSMSSRRRHNVVEMRTLFLLPAQLLPISTRIFFPIKIFNPLLTDSTHFHKPTRILSLKMTTESTPSQLTHAITLPAQLDQPVTVVAAAGVSESNFRHVFHLILSWSAQDFVFLLWKLFVLKFPVQTEFLISILAYDTIFVLHLRCSYRIRSMLS